MVKIWSSWRSFEGAQPGNSGILKKITKFCDARTRESLATDVPLSFPPLPLTSDSHNHPPLTEPTEWWDLTALGSIFDQLTERDQLILHAITNGETNIEIASRLGIAEKSAEKHITKLFSKLGVSQRVKAAVFYTLWMVLQSPDPISEPPNSGPKG